MLGRISVTDKRIAASTNWARDVQILSPTSVDLAESAASVIRASDLARTTARDLAIPFEAEPSAFVKLLNELAPDDEC